jgi:hypothetical protein
MSSTNSTGVGRSPLRGSGHSAEPEPCSTVSAVPASVLNADWLYSTFVFRHADEAARKALTGELFERFPFFDEGEAPSRLTAVSIGDAMSVSDAMRMALECSELDPSERTELALEMAERGTWQGCMALASEWELRVNEVGELVNEQVPA